MEFITIAHPSEGTSAKLKRRAYAHAARVTHARARRRQVTDHLSQKGIAVQETPKVEALDHPSESRTQMGMRRQQHYQALAHQGANTLLPRPVSGAFEQEPFAGFLGSLTPREQFMFNHYVDVVFPYLDKHCPVVQGLNKYDEYTRKNWILASSNDVDFLRGFLLAACRHLSLVGMYEEYAQLAIQYKLNHIHIVRAAIATENLELGRIAVTRALVLAFDEIMLGDMPMASKHVKGALHIVNKAGGPEALGLSVFIAYILDSCIRSKRLLDWEPAVHCGDKFMKPESIMV